MKYMVEEGDRSGIFIPSRLDKARNQLQAAESKLHYLVFSPSPTVEAIEDVIDLLRKAKVQLEHE